MGDQITMLVLLEREHDRIKKQLAQLSTYDVDIDDLETLQHKWQEQLCFAPCASPLLAALGNLIQRRENEAYPTDAYDEVIYQVHVYKHESKTLLNQAFGSSLAPYLNQFGHLHKQYRKLYKQNMEPHKKLPIFAQAEYIRSKLGVLFPTPATSNAIHQSREALAQAAKQQTTDVLLQNLMSQLASMKQLVEEAQHPKPSSSADIVTLEAYRQTS